MNFFKKVLLFFRNLFKSKPEVEEVEIEEVEIEEEKEESNMSPNIIRSTEEAKQHVKNHGHPGFALLIGHNTLSQGAENYKKETEYSFNSRIARKVAPSIKANVVILERPPIANYTENCQHIREVVRELKVPLVLSLHFNAYTRPIDGAEALLVTTASDLDDKLGDKITDLLNEKLGIKERGKDGVKLLTSGTRAYKMHTYIKEVGSILVTIEPCFANYRTPESEAIFEREDDYVDILVESINEILNQKL